MELALSRFRQVVGERWVFESDEDRDGYLDPFAPGSSQAFAAAAGVAPASTDEVQAIVRIASELGIPIWPVSCGKNFAYGGAAPRVTGSVVLDLKRMQRIEVNPELAFAVVEPGVSFFDLYDFLQTGNHALWISSPAPGWGSVIGNALERGFGPTPYGDHSAQVCGLEVVLADGELVRTGMGGVPNAETFHTFKNGFGPAYDGLFMQANFGIVTKLGIWLMPAPEEVMLCDVKFAAETDLVAAVDALRPLRLSGVIPSVASIRNAVGIAAASSSRDQWWNEESPIPGEAIGAMVRKLDIGWWNMSFGLYGSSAVTAAQLVPVSVAFGAINGATMSVRTLDKASLSSPNRGDGGSRVGVPSLAAFQLLNWRGGAGAHVDFSPVLSPRGSDAFKLYQLTREIIETGGLDYIGTFYNFGRAMALICAVVFDREKPSDTSALKAIFPQLIARAGAAGYGEYRTHLAYMDEVAAQYAWNKHALLRLSERIKNALDPRGILAPGKQGVWPSGRPS